MNIELDEVVVLDVSDEALELAAGGAQGDIRVFLSFPDSARRDDDCFP